VNTSLPRIALLGCGAIAESYYLPALARHPNIMESLFLVDKNLARAQKMAADFKVKRYLTDYCEVLGQVDGVIIALPTHLHAPVAIDCLARGIPVFCEKPLAESADQAVAMLEQAQQSQTSLAVNYLQRLIPAFAKTRELLAERTLGEPLSIRYFVGEEFRWPTFSGFYFNAPIASRGILRDRGAHVMDHICWWLGGKPQLISSQNDAQGGSETVSNVKFVHGHCSGEVLLNWLTNMPCKFTIVCEAGTIEGDVYDYHSLTILRNGKQQHLKLVAKEKSKVDIADTLVTNFLEVITHGARPLISGEAVLDSLRFIDECYARASRFEMPWYQSMEVKNG
jgi:predicted dehydrogenase